MCITDKTDDNIKYFILSYAIALLSALVRPTTLYD